MPLVEKSYKKRVFERMAKRDRESCFGRDQTRSNQRSINRIRPYLLRFQPVLLWYEDWIKRLNKAHEKCKQTKQGRVKWKFRTRLVLCITCWSLSEDRVGFLGNAGSREMYLANKGTWLKIKREQRETRETGIR